MEHMGQISSDLKLLLEKAVQKAGKEKVEKALRDLISEEKKGEQDIIDFIIENVNRKEQPAGVIIAAATVKNLSNTSWYQLKQRKREIPEEKWRELEKIWVAKKKGKELEAMARLYINYK